MVFEVQLTVCQLITSIWGFVCSTSPHHPDDDEGEGEEGDA